jgi:hypothetical protein
MQRWVATRSDVSRVDVHVQLNRGVLASDGVHPGEPVYRQTSVAIAQHIATHVLPRLHLTQPAAAPTPTTTQPPMETTR